MDKRSLLPLLLVAALTWVVFASVGLWFTARLESKHRQDVQEELSLVTDRTVANVVHYLERVTRAVEASLSAPIDPADDTRGALSRRFRFLCQSYPEIRSLVYVDDQNRVFTAAPGQDLRSTELHPTDVLESPSLLLHTGVDATGELRVTVTDLARYEPSLDPMVQPPALLFVKQLVRPSGERGTVLMPYTLDFIAESLLQSLSSPGRRELSLVSHRGLVVYSTLAPLRHGTDLPSFAGGLEPSHAFAADPSETRNAATTGQTFFATFSIPGDADVTDRYTGCFAPLELGGTRWTLATASRDLATWPSRDTLLVPPLLGSLALVLIPCGIALIAFRSTQRDLLEIARFRAAVASSGMGIAMFDQNDRYLYVNPAYTTMTGAAPGQVLGQQVQTRSDAFEEPDLLARVLPQVRAGQPWKGEARLRRESGEDAEWRDLVFTVSPIVQGGAYHGCVTSALDVTSEARVRRQLEVAKRELEGDVQAREKAEHERERLQQELRRSQTLEAVGQLAGGVAHDFNNILASIIGCLYVVEQQVGSDPTLAREIASIKNLCKRGGDLNRQLLAVGRRDTGRREPVDAGEFLANLGLLLKRTLPPHIALALDIPERLPAVRGNRSNLLAAFLNLGLNARDAMPDGGRLEIRAHVDMDQGAAGCVVVEVEDTGTGIPAEIMDRVFEPFFTTKGVGLGTGLGLATAHAAVEECGGTITLRSTPGVGTRFTVQLPAVERRTRSRVKDAAPFSHPVTTRPVLVVEDEPGIERLIRATLEGAGYTVVCATDGAEALARLRDHGQLFGAATLDLMLPEVSGTDVLEELRQNHPALPVLLVTAREDLARAALRGAPYLPKPFTSVDLLEALGQLLHCPGDQSRTGSPEEPPAGTSDGRSSPGTA